MLEIILATKAKRHPWVTGDSGQGSIVDLVPRHHPPRGTPAGLSSNCITTLIILVLLLARASHLLTQVVLLHCLHTIAALFASHKRGMRTSGRRGMLQPPLHGYR